MNEQYDDPTGDTPVDELPPEELTSDADGQLAANDGEQVYLAAFRQDLRDGLIALGKKNTQLEKQITQLEQNFETKLMYDQSKDQTIDALHRELQDYREGLQFVHLRPLVNDLLTLYDDLGGILDGFTAEHSDTAADAPVNRLLDSLRTIQEDMQYMLEKHGFELYEYAGDEIDRKLQRVQGTIPTADPAEDRLVAARLRPGLRYGERILRPETVQAYRYESADDTDV